MVAKAPEFQNKIVTCLEGKTTGNISVMFDVVIAEGDFDQYASAPVFVQMLDAFCDTDVASTITVGGRESDAGGGGGAVTGCTPVATLPEGLLLDLTRSGQLSVLFEQGALC